LPGCRHLQLIKFWNVEHVIRGDEVEERWLRWLVEQRRRATRAS
jgi:hypothetical protein